MNIGVIGLGLIGGSFALAAKKHLDEVRLYGADQNGAHLQEALTKKIIDQELTPANHAQMDILILAIPRA